MFWLTLIAVTTVVLSLGFLIAELCLFKRPALQDVVWRSCLVALFLFPMGILLRPWLPRLEIRLPLSLGSLTSGMEEKMTTLPGQSEPPTIAKVAVQPQDDTTSNALNANFSEIDGTQALIRDTQTSPQKLETTRDSSIELLTANFPTVALEPAKPRASYFANASYSANLGPVLILIWLAVAILKLLQVASHWFRSRRILRTSTADADSKWKAITKELSPKTIQVAFSPQILSPMVGPTFRRSTILIPMSMREEKDEELIRLVLSHELAHIQRRDFFYGVLISIACAILWFHPLCFWMKRRVIWLREVLCDAQVASRFGVVRYAEALLQTASHQHNSLEMAMGGSTSMLASRVQAMFSTPAPRLRTAPRAYTLMVWCMMGIGTAGVTFVQAAGPITNPTNTEPTPRINEQTDPASRAQQDIKSTFKLQGKVIAPQGSASRNGLAYIFSRSEGSNILPVKSSQARVDDEGNFEFSDLKPGKYIVWAETDELTSLTGMLKGKQVEIASADQQVDLQLLAACKYKVVVKDKKTKQPIPNAEISFGWTDIDRSYRTGKDGIAFIGGLAANDWYFRVKANKYDTVFLKTPTQSLGSVTELDFELDVGSTLLGQVVDQDGNPIPECRIYAGQSDIAMSPYFASRDLITDAEGKFEIHSLPREKPLYADFDKKGYDRFKRQEFTIPADQEKFTLSIQMKKLPYGGDCRVLVSDEAGNPIAGAIVTNNGRSSADVSKATTDENGEAVVQDLFSKFDGIRGVIWAEGFVAKEIELEKGTIAEPGRVTAQLTKGHTIRARIVDAMGKPASGLSVYFNGGENGATIGGSTKSDKEGRFKIDGLPLRSVFTIYTLPPHGPFQKRLLPVGEEDEIVVQLEREAVIRVRAFDMQSKEPLSAFNVKLGFTSDRRPNDPRVNGLASELVENGKNILGDVKEFRHGQLAPGTPLQVTVSAEGYEPTTLGRVEASLEDEGKVVDVHLEKEDPSQWKQMNGILLDANSKPLANATIVLVSSAKNPLLLNWSSYRWDMVERGQLKRDPKCVNYLQAVTNSAGEFKFAKVKNAEWNELFVFGNKVVKCRFPLDASNQEPVLKLVTPKPGTLKLNIDPKFWTDAHSVQVSASSRMQPDLTSAFNSERIVLDPAKDSITLENVPPGNYVISLQGKPEPIGGQGFTTKTVKTLEVTVEEGESVEVDF